MTVIDLRMVASLATAAYAHGDRMCGAIADHYDITRRDAKTLLTRARRAGHDIPMDRRGPQGTLRHGTRYHYRKGCRCDACTAANRRHQQEQQARRGVGRANPGRPPVERGAVRCSCGQQCKDRTALGAHTWSAHNRWPTDAERVIIAEQVAA